MAPKTTGCNEFNSSIATAIVCLARGTSFNFSKMILNGLISGVKSDFWLYPRFVQLLVEHSIQKTRTHKATFDVLPMNAKMFVY